MKIWAKRLALICALCSLSACQSSETTEAIPLTESNNARVTEIHNEPSPTPLMQAASTTSSLDFPETSTPNPVVVSDEFLEFVPLVISSLENPRCTNSCWQGELEIGRSSWSDSRVTIQNYFNLNEIANTDIGLISNNEIAEYFFQFESEELGARITVSVNDDTNIVELFTIEYLGPASIELVLETLDTPNYMFAQVTQTGAPELLEMRILLLYEQGYVFRFNDILTKQGASEFQLCLDSTVNGMVNYTETYDFYDVPLSATQVSIISGTIADFNLVPIEEILGLTPEQLAEAAIAEEGACFDLAAQS